MCPDRPALRLLLALGAALLAQAGASASAETVRDQFDAISFSNNNGTRNWATDWIEIGEADGPNAGDVRIVSDLGSNRLRVKDNDSGGEGVMREADLASASSATLSFVYRRDALDDANDWVEVSVSANGGAAWTPLARYQGPGTDAAYQPASFNILPWASANTRVRFLSSPSLGDADIVYFDNVEIAFVERPHFAIGHDGSGNRCASEPVTITRHLPSHATDTTWTGTISLSTSTGNGSWSLLSGSGSLVDLGGGNASYSYVLADAGQVTLGLADGLNETVDIDVTAGLESEGASEDPALVFDNATSGNVRDAFNAASFANSDGSLAWLGPWTEVGEADGAAAGDIAVVSDGGALRLRIRNQTEGAERGANLLGWTAATLSFVYRRDALDNAQDYVTLEISGNGGLSWNELDRWVGGGTDAGYLPESYDISGYVSANTRIRFRGSPLLGNTDQVYFDDVNIALAGSAACPAAHFEIAHAGSSVACVEVPVSITRHDPSHNPDSGYTGTITLSTSTNTGDWSLLAGDGILTNLGNGAGSYAFAASDAGQVQLGLTDAGTTLNIDVTDGASSEDLFEDPDLSFGPGANQDARDEFGAVSYSNDDGTVNWSTAWIELDVAPPGPAAGNAFVAGGELWLDDFPNSDLEISVERQVDLTGVTTASFSFDWRTTFGVDANDSLFIDISSNGGAGWTTLEDITGIAGVQSGSKSYDISSFASPNTRVRFRVNGVGGAGSTNCCYGGPDENFIVDHVVVSFPSPFPCAATDHFSIAHDGSAVSCQAEPIAITAHDAPHGTEAGYTEQITLSTSTGHGDWSLISGGGVLVNAGNGSATYQFVGADGGQVVLGLLDTFLETVGINVSDGMSDESPAEDPSLVVAQTGFTFLADGVASAVGLQIAGKPSNVAPGAQLLELQAIRTSDTTGTCEAALQGTNPIDLAFECRDPSACWGALVSVNGSPIAANPLGPIGAWTSVGLDFGGPTDTTAPLVISYPDAGRIRLHARKTLAPSGQLMLGASNEFAVRPFAFDLAATGNPGATGPAGPLFTAAGADFGATLRSVVWQAADDLDADGVADGHADANPATGANLTDNAATPGFGKELAAEGVALAASLVDPAAGNDPGLAGGTTLGGFAAGSASTANLYYDEVGVIELASAIADANYLGIGATATANIVGRSGYVGRFHPDHFDVTVATAPLLATACGPGGFTYLGQPFGWATAPVLRVTPRSTRGSQTRNYTGAWFKLSNATLAGRSYTSDPGAPESLDLSGLPPSASDPTIDDVGDGTATLSFALGSGLRFSRSGPPLASPFDAEISLAIDVIDADAIVYPGNPFRIGAASPGNGIAWSAGKQQRFGRLVLENAYGSELSALAEPLRAEYWQGSGFVVNGDDVCTTVRDGTAPVGPAHLGTTARSPVTLATSPDVASEPLLFGDAGLTWAAAGAAGYADVLVNLSGAPVVTPWGTISGAALPWLQYDWTNDGAGPFDDDPTARITFGIFPGRAPVIFQREVY